MSQRPPRIAVSAAFMHADAQRAIFKGKTLLYAEESLLHWLQRGSALPYILPTALPALGLKAYMEDCDGLLLQGGVDIAPSSYGETPERHDWVGDAVRDAYELELLRTAMALDKPVLGICRGAQLINVGFGGTLYQDIETLYEATAKRKPQLHRDWHEYDQLSHDVAFVPGSKLAQLYEKSGAKGGRVNSVHHQAVKKLGKDLVVEAEAPEDGMVEAVRHKGKAWVFGTQWHPEFIADSAGDMLSSRPILEDFIQAVNARR